jgi:hypothetical protein
MQPVREATVKHINYNDIAISLVSSALLHSTSNLDQLESSFMRTQLFKNAFLAIGYEDASNDKFVTYCRDYFEDNPSELTIVNELAIT